MQQRYYDPVIGRFYSNDPVGFSASNPMMFNRYAYANNNPYKYVDPDGNAPIELMQAAIFDSALIENDGDYKSAMDSTNSEMDAMGDAQLTAISIIDTVSDVLAPIKGLTKNAIQQAIKRTCCFVAGTQVLTESGYKNIEDVKLGEKLWAKNTETGEQDWKPVTKIFVEPDRGIYEIQLVGADGFKQKIQATDDHPFYVVNKGWIKTLELSEGDLIETDGHGSMKVLSVVNENRTDLTYNFTVADFHTYYVTKKNVLVHNCNLGTKSVLTNKQAQGVAEGLGFKKVTGNVPNAIQKQVGKNPVYFDKKTNSYYSPDKAGHRADNAWKKFDSSGKRETGVFNEKGEFKKVSE